MSSFFSQSHQIQQGELLLADPSLKDGIFDKSVILIAQHTSEGAFGLILNQPAGNSVGDYLVNDQYEALSSIPIFVGGPVAREHLTFAAFWTSPDHELRFAIRISAEEAIKHSKNPGTLVRAFTGYAGWSSGQLEEEIHRQSWVIAPAPKNFLGKLHDQSLWKETLTGLSPFHKLLALCPDHPWLN